MSPTDSLRIMVVGNKHVGKSALVVKYLTGRFIGEYQSDVESRYCSKIMIDGEEIQMEILDSTNQDENLVRWAEGFMVVYDVTDQKGFDRIGRIRKELEHAKSAKNMSYVVVGNKTDLQHCRQVTVDMAEHVCLQMAVAHFECCACAANDDIFTKNIHDAFEELCREIQNRRRINGQNRRGRRSSIIQSFKGLVNPNKSRRHLSPTSGNSSLSTSRRGSSASIGRRDSISGLLDRAALRKSPIPNMDELDSKYGRSQALARSLGSYYGSSLSVKQ